MKQTMNYLSVAALVVMGAMMASCVKEDIAQHEETPRVVEPAAEDNIVVCTTTVSFDTEATKSLNEYGVKTFASGEMIAVIYKNTSSQTVKAVSDPLPSGDYGNTASFTVALTNPATNADLRIIYPAAMAAETVATDVAVNAEATINYAALNSQDGTLATLSSNLDLAVYDGNLEGTALPADPALHNKLAICIYTLKNSTGVSEITSSITGLAISDGTYNYSVIRSAAAGPIYVAIRPTSDATINYTATDGTNHYKKTVTAKTYAASQMYPLGLRMADYDGINLATLSGDCTAQHGDVIYGELYFNYQVSIADGATVTLSNVTIDGYNSHPYDWAGITCQGDATIILKDGTTNSVQGFHENYPGLFVPEGKTLTIRGETAGTGILNASSTGNGSGIGGGWEIACGNIEIQGGYINATGDFGAAGIGSGLGASCGDITISGGTVTAIGGNVPSYEIGGAGIGSGHDGSSCGNITISDGTVKAYGGTCAAGIGCGHWSSCGNITISSGTIIAVGGNWAAGIGSGDGWTSDSSKTSSCGDITIKNTVTSVSATKGNNDVPDSIGAGFSGTCGTVTIQSGANVTQY